MILQSGAPARAPQPPAAPTPAAQVTTPPGWVVDMSRSGANMTAEDVHAANLRLNQLRRELQDAAERRASVSGRLREADLEARSGLIGRLQVLDSRILAIETEITALNGQLASAPAMARIGAAEIAESNEPNPGQIAQTVAQDFIPIVAILSVFVFAPIAIAISRLIWKRATNAPRVSAAPDQASQQRLEQLQQAVDAIAIEVERISEGQRFVTKIMSDRSIGAGAAEPVRNANKSAIPSERG
jgi:hypothetical protein